MLTGYYKYYKYFAQSQTSLVIKCRQRYLLTLPWIDNFELLPTQREKKYIPVVAGNDLSDLMAQYDKLRLD